jgi:hypothetical protein
VCLWFLILSVYSPLLPMAKSHITLCSERSVSHMRSLVTSLTFMFHGIRYYYAHFRISLNFVLFSEAWFLDCDALWVAQASSLKSLANGHIFGSMDAVCGGTHTATHRLMKWQIQYTRRPTEKLYICSPFRIPSQSPWLADAIATLQVGFLSPTALPYLYFMQSAALLLHF